uniref:ABC transporter domain-containing protein n=1 Tax=Brugia malayi TaxID=6279 RepID=A0A5S6PJ25_BRUMA
MLDELYVFECRNVSSTCTITPSKWYNYTSSKVTAQFLKEISIVVQSGEIHGIIGSAGQMFDSICAFVNFNQALIETISIRAMLKFQAGIMISDLNDQEITERINLLLQEFDLITYQNILICDLNESARKRLLLCMRLISNPILIILDEPTTCIDALSNYQLMYALSTYVKRTGTMAIIATRTLRSDLYQLLSRVTILFYGETIYSGATQQLPLYFNHIGFPCPINENPATYYLSLVMIDRETTERYRETQEQALKLIDLFKNNIDLQSEVLHSIQLTKRLLFHGRPSSSYQFFILLQRSFCALNSSAHIVLLRLLLLPLLTLLICFCSTPFSTSDEWWSPQDKAALLIIYSTLFSIVSIFLTIFNESIVHGQCEQDVTDGVYSEILSILSFSLASMLNDLLAFTSSIFIITFWHFYSQFSENWNYIWNLALPLWCCYQYFQILVLIVIFYTKKAEFTAKFLIEFCFGSVICAGSFFIAPRTFVSTNDLRHILMYINFYRYLFSFINFKFIDGTKAGNCIFDSNKPLEQFCRWTNGTMFLNEYYPESWNYSMETFNYYFIIFFVIIIAIVSLLCFKFNK